MTRSQLYPTSESEEKVLQAAHKSPFSQFYQVNKNHSDELIWLVKENRSAYCILLFLTNHMDKYNAVMCSYTVLQEALGVSPATIRRAIKLLKENGYIHIYKSGTSNVYVLNPDLVWNSWGNNKQYCQFPVNVILSKSEQKSLSDIKHHRTNIIESAS